MKDHSTMYAKTANLIATALIAASAATAEASFFDGKQPLICSVYQLYECDHPNKCVSVTPGEINAMSHFDIDFRKKVIIRTGEAAGQKSSIKDVLVGLDGKLIIQGVEDGDEDERDGAGWTISIMDPEGTMVMAIAGDGFGVIGLGGCVPKP
jgi:hypothetical protein